MAASTGATIPITRSRAEAARLLVQTADRWGQPVPAGVREMAKALDDAPPTKAKKPSTVATNTVSGFDDQGLRSPNTEALVAIAGAIREAHSLWAPQGVATIEKAVNELYDQGLLKGNEAAAIFLALTSADTAAPD
jgi:hypothetical protein